MAMEIVWSDGHDLTLVMGIVLVVDICHCELERETPHVYFAQVTVMIHVVCACSDQILPLPDHQSFYVSDSCAPSYACALSYPSSSSFLIWNPEVLAFSKDYS
jgi:hypothetical protein